MTPQVPRNNGRRLEKVLLLFSLGLNVAFVSIAAVRSNPQAPDPRSEESEMQAPVFERQWHRKRAAVLSRRLGLDHDRRRVMREHLREMRPALHEARRDLASARRAFRAALREQDVETARVLQHQVSRAQARLDSLTAEAMLLETRHLSPTEREAYLQWTFERPRERPRRFHRGPRRHPGPL